VPFDEPRDEHPDAHEEAASGDPQRRRLEQMALHVGGGERARDDGRNHGSEQGSERSQQHRGEQDGHVEPLRGDVLTPAGQQHERPPQPEQDGHEHPVTNASARLPPSQEEATHVEPTREASHASGIGRPEPGIDVGG
jgi:hypothetical protein